MYWPFATTTVDTNVVGPASTKRVCPVVHGPHIVSVTPDGTVFVQVSRVVKPVGTVDEDCGRNVERVMPMFVELPPADTDVFRKAANAVARGLVNYYTQQQQTGIQTNMSLYK